MPKDHPNNRIEIRKHAEKSTNYLRGKARYLCPTIAYSLLCIRNLLSTDCSHYNSEHQLERIKQHVTLEWNKV